jgi:DNA-binding NtrC family response regulator
MNVMLVEDDAAHAQLILMMLAKERDLTVSHATNLRSARELLKVLSFALVLLDYSLPDGTGLELFSELRARYANVPVIFLTSLDSAEICARVMKGGAVDYVVKKLNYLESLPRIVRKALKAATSSASSGAQSAQMATPASAKPKTERERLVAALDRNRWNRGRTAQELAISRITLWRRMRKYGLYDRDRS